MDYNNICILIGFRFFLNILYLFAGVQVRCMLCEYNMRMTKARLNVCCLHDPLPEISFLDKLFVTRMLMSLEISHTEQF
jgi:hypothetical protein